MTLVEQLDVRAPPTCLCVSSLQINANYQEIIKDFERNYSDLVGSFLEGVQSQYPTCQCAVVNIHVSTLHL